MRPRYREWSRERRAADRLHDAWQKRCSQEIEEPELALMRLLASWLRNPQEAV